MAGKKKKTHKNRFFGITSRVLMAIVAALLALSYLSVVINPAKIWVMSLFGLLFVPLMTLNIFLLVWAIIRKSKSFIIPLLALIPSLFFIGRYVQLNPDDTAQQVSEEKTVKVLSWNVGRFAARNKEIKTRTQCMDSVLNFISRQDADIICLQEFYISDESKIKSLVGRKMPGYKAEYYMFTGRNGSFGNLTLSRFPVKDKGKIKFEESANLAIYTDYAFEDRRFRIYNCHFESYNVSVSGLVKGIAGQNNSFVTETGTKMKRSITRRPKQVDKVFSDIENCPIESFVCGDFNDNPMSYTYFRMTRDREDSFVEAGQGFGSTYSLLWPMLRIDFVLYPSRFRAVSHTTPRVKFSDHYPVITEIAL